MPCRLAYASADRVNRVTKYSAHRRRPAPKNPALRPEASARARAAPGQTRSVPDRKPAAAMLRPFRLVEHRHRVVLDRDAAAAAGVHQELIAAKAEAGGHRRISPTMRGSRSRCCPPPSPGLSRRPAAQPPRRCGSPHACRPIRRRPCARCSNAARAFRCWRRWASARRSRRAACSASCPGGRCRAAASTPSHHRAAIRRPACAPSSPSTGSGWGWRTEREHVRRGVRGHPASPGCAIGSDGAGAHGRGGNQPDPYSPCRKRTDPIPHAAQDHSSFATRFQEHKYENLPIRSRCGRWPDRRPHRRHRPPAVGGRTRSHTRSAAARRSRPGDRRGARSLPRRE